MSYVCWSDSQHMVTSRGLPNEASIFRHILREMNKQLDMHILHLPSLLHAQVTEKMDKEMKDKAQQKKGSLRARFQVNVRQTEFAGNGRAIAPLRRTPNRQTRSPPHLSNSYDMACWPPIMGSQPW